MATTNSSENSMDLRFRKDGQWQRGGGRGNRFALMSEISRENIIKIYFETWIFSYQNCNMNREEVSILHSYKHVMVENQKLCSMWIQRNHYFKRLRSLVEVCRNRDRSKCGYLINVWLNTLVKFSWSCFLTREVGIILLCRTQPKKRKFRQDLIKISCNSQLTHF